MKTQNTNNQTTTTKTTNVLNEMQKNVIANFANALKNAIADNYNEITIKKVFKNFADWKKENKDFALVANKTLFANFDKLTIAKIKVLTRINTEKTTKTSETAKTIANVIFADVETQRKKVRGMLSNAVERKSQIYKLAFSKAFYLSAFDALTNDEFLSLYKGVATIKVENVIGLLTTKLNATK